MRILSVHGALPDHRYRQAEITAAFADEMLATSVDRAVLERLHRNAGVGYRHLALPLERYGALAGFGEANDDFIEVGVELGARASHRRAEAPGPRRPTST